MIHSILIGLIITLAVLGFLAIGISAFTFQDAEDEESKALGGTLFLLIGAGLLIFDFILIVLMAIF
jgi:hypothetical protein